MAKIILTSPVEFLETQNTKMRIKAEEDIKLRALEIIRKFVPNGFELIYSEKSRQAELYLSEAEPDDTDMVRFGFLIENMVQDGHLTLTTSAQSILQKRDLMAVIGPQIESLRRTAVNSLTSMNTQAEVDTLVESVSIRALTPFLISLGINLNDF